MKEVLFNADDFGLSRGINEGIIKAFKGGMLKSASLMVTGDAFMDAVELARKNPLLNTGIHLTLVGGKSVLMREAIPTLVTNEGFFRKDFYSFMQSYLLGSIELKDIEREIRAQFEKYLGMGLKIRHVNSHQHIHIIPSIFRVVKRICDEFEIRNIRIPYEPLRLNFIRRPRRFLDWIVLSFLIKLLRSKFHKDDGFDYFDFRGFFDSGNLTTNSLKNILRTVKARTEIICHPGIPDRLTAEKYASWQYSWESELKILTSEDLRRLVEEEGVKII